MYEWHGKPYLGAAHGMAGILYILLQVGTHVPQGPPLKIRGIYFFLYRSTGNKIILKGGLVEGCLMSGKNKWTYLSRHYQTWHAFTVGDTEYME